MSLPTLSFEFDPWTDIVTIEGMKYTGALFREFAIGPLDRPIKIIKREDGVITVQVLELSGEQR